MHIQSCSGLLFRLHLNLTLTTDIIFCYFVVLWAARRPSQNTIFIYGVYSLLVNYAQVRLQTMPQPEPGQKPMFTGTLDCALKTVRKEVRLKRSRILKIDYTFPMLAWKRALLAIQGALRELLGRCFLCLLSSVYPPIAFMIINGWNLLTMLIPCQGVTIIIIHSCFWLV